MKETMLAAMVYGKDDLRLEYVPVPRTPVGSILIKMDACAICGTDMRIYKKGDFRARYPVITGHEIAGTVVETAPGVSHVREGDRICVAPGHGCGYCRMCLAGQPNVCTNPHPSLGYKLNGGFAEYMAVPEHIFRLGFVNPIPDELSSSQASMSEIIACCLNAQRNAPVRERDTVLIIGAGPAGIIHALLARLSGAEKVIISQRSRPRLDAIRDKMPSLADALIASSESDLNEAVMTLTIGEGADVVFVCAPSREAQEQALKLAGNRARVNFFGGLPKDDCIVQVNSNELHYKELFLSGASSSLPETNRQALELLRTRRIDPDILITHELPLQRIDEGFRIMEERNCIKVVIRP
jgi:L-iditol 2-dehydrogenase